MKWTAIWRNEWDEQSAKTLKQNVFYLWQCNAMTFYLVTLKRNCELCESTRKTVLKRVRWPHEHPSSSPLILLVIIIMSQWASLLHIKKINVSRKKKRNYLSFIYFSLFSLSSVGLLLLSQEKKNVQSSLPIYSSLKPLKTTLSCVRFTNWLRFIWFRSWRGNNDANAQHPIFSRKLKGGVL